MLNRILAQNWRVYINDQLYLYQQSIPWDLAAEADEIRDTFLRENKFGAFLRRANIVPMLVQRGLLNPDYESELSKVNTSIQNTLLALYKDYEMVTRREQHRLRLDQLRGQVGDVYSLIFTHELHSIEGIADSVRQDFLISRLTKDSLGYPIPDELIDTFRNKYIEMQPTTPEIRKLARNDGWKSMWLLMGMDIFIYRPISELQNTLATYSRMYENVYQHHECPPQQIIEDDDALDGWFISQHRDRLKDDAPQTGSAYKETIIFAKDKDEANAIYASNSDEAKAIQEMRMNQLKKNKIMKHGDFADVKHRQRLENARQSYR